MRHPERWAHCTLLVGPLRAVGRRDRRARRLALAASPRTIRVRFPHDCARRDSARDHLRATTCSRRRSGARDGQRRRVTRWRCCACSPSVSSATLELRVLHVNHLLRGDESDARRAFVRELAARRWQVECRVGSLRRGRVCRRRAAQPRGRRAPRPLPLRRGGARRVVRRARARTSVTAASPSHTRSTTGSRRSSCARSRAAGTGGLTRSRTGPRPNGAPLLDCDRLRSGSGSSRSASAWREDASNADTTRSRALVRAPRAAAGRRADVNPSVRSTIVARWSFSPTTTRCCRGWPRPSWRDFAEVRPG